jgi:hypothetical protein
LIRAFRKNPNQHPRIGKTRERWHLPDAVFLGMLFTIGRLFGQAHAYREKRKIGHRWTRCLVETTTG